MQELHIENHYVPRLYLKNWSDDSNKIWIYHTLVSNDAVPLWNSRAISGIAYFPYLYIRDNNGVLQDDFESWFSSEFENPVAPVFKKVLSNQHLLFEDWQSLIRFTAAQIVRTPVSLIKTLEWSKSEMSGIIDETINDLKNAIESNNIVFSSHNSTSLEKELLPINVEIRTPSDSGKSEVKIETTINRNIWLYSIHHLLTETIKVLYNHKWSIMHAAEGVEWITSDDPVIRLNYYKPGSYDFGGGWNNRGSLINSPRK